MQQIKVILITNMLKLEGFCFHVCTILSRDKFSFVCYTFVDDSHVVHSSTKADMDTRTGLVNKEMQPVVATWEGGVRSAGGVLFLSKSYWFLIPFVLE